MSDKLEKQNSDFYQNIKTILQTIKTQAFLSEYDNKLDSLRDETFSIMESI